MCIRPDVLIPDELGYLCFNQVCGSVLFHLPINLYMSVIVAINLPFG